MYKRQGVDFSSITYEDIRWQYGVFRCNSTGSGRDKKHLPWDGVKTNLGEIEEKDWCRLADAVIERDGETHLLKHLIQWCSEHNYICLLYTSNGGHNMKLSEDEAKRFLERLCPLQETEQQLLCPRCGRNELYSGLYFFLNLSLIHI